ALGRLVAIKELSPALLAVPGFLERFRAEAQVLSGLDDRHVVRLYDYVEEPSRAYLVQEWVEGAPLGAVLQQHGRLSPEQSLGVLRGGLIGLAHAHGRGLVHRDVSPANILLDRDGVSKLVDFGLAAPSGSAAGLVGSSVGTPAFGSPEAVTGQTMTARSDVYSAAGVLFLLLTGRLPYAGDLSTVLQAHVTSPVPVLSGFAPRLTDLVWRAMAKDPMQRPADAAAFLAELEEAAGEAYGAGWLGRASVAGLATAGATAVGSVAALGGAGVPAAVQALAYGTANTPAVLAGQQVPAAATAVGAHVLGIPRVALMVASAVVVTAVAATVVVLTVSSDDPEPAAAGRERAGQESTTTGAAESERPTTTAPTTAATTISRPPPVPVLNGTYEAAVTLTAKAGDVDSWPEIGSVETFTWTVTGSCPSGLCDAAVVSSDGSTFTLTYAAGTWTQDTSYDAECVDSVTQVPTGDTVALTGARTLTAPPAAGLDPTASLAGLTGAETLSVPEPGCGSGGVDVTYELSLTRTGD
ncbi:MAG: serine/threonine protein kinase, partial [Geodermatophilaceae bacterium]|nr:serine/threonine protein kinase [Geodermatophilaceae bacterium]